MELTNIIDDLCEIKESIEAVRLLISDVIHNHFEATDENLMNYSKDDSAKRMFMAVDYICKAKGDVARKIEEAKNA